MHHHRIASLVVFLFLLGLGSTLHAEGQRLLFIGNSYTYGNDLDQMTATLLAKGAENWTDVEANRHAAGGARFAQHLAQADGTDGETALRTWLSGPSYFAVILQEQSQIPGFPQSNAMFQESLTAFLGLNQEVEQNGAHTLALMTWGRRTGDSQNAIRYPDFKVMQEHLRNGYFEYARAASTDSRSVVVIPAGIAFEKVYDDILAAGNDPLTESSLFWNLYAGDGSHPALLGTYLTACTIYGSLTGQPLQGVEWAPEGIDADTRDVLQRAANYAVFERSWDEGIPALFVENSEPEPEPDPVLEIEEEPEQEETASSTDSNETGADDTRSQGGGCASCTAVSALPIYLLIPVVWVMGRRRRSGIE